jgi:pimeloyl-ACP methyl ester carboxylesterase
MDRRVRLGHVELHVEDRGSGSPPLLLIAGIPAVADDWEPLAAPLSERRRVIAYDNRGSGRSTVTPGPYTTAQPAPTLILTGDDDRVIPAESSDLLHELIPDCSLRVLPGTGHLFFVEAPARTRELIEGFLD